MNLSEKPIYTIILFSLILFSCTERDEKFVPEKFENRKKVVVLDTIANHPSWYYGVRDLQNNPNLFIIRNSKFNGVIVREKNKIRLIKFKH
jgi:hypothetical protein